MRRFCTILLVVMALVLVCGCVGSYPNPYVVVKSDTLDSFDPVNTGSVDFYTADVRIENPTNRTFSNVQVQVIFDPVTAYCHSQSATFDIPSLAPQEKLTEHFSFSEFADLDCAYNFTSSVVSDQKWL
ncbi:MAG: hypothetical protein LUQ31_02630 [Methanoregula sp.]|nr:hypothetical protein [Methanoregula sp.]